MGGGGKNLAFTAGRKKERTAVAIIKAFEGKPPNVRCGLDEHYLPPRLPPTPAQQQQQQQQPEVTLHISTRFFWWFGGSALPRLAVGTMPITSACQGKAFVTALFYRPMCGWRSR